MDFYKLFEDKYRGSRDEIKERLRAYQPFINQIKLLDSTPRAIDLGCGRGEWIEFLTENRFDAIGIDLDADMLEECKKRGYNVKLMDAIQALKDEQSDSFWVVSGFHIVEHIGFDNIMTLIKEALRVLKDGGLLILETPNPDNMRVGTSSFYLDPTHDKPIPSKLLSFMAEYAGFKRAKVVFLQEPEDAHNMDNIGLAQVFNWVSPDYAIVAQKAASIDVENLFLQLFSKEYGITFEKLSEKFESRYENRLNILIDKIDGLDARVVDHEIRVSDNERILSVLLNFREKVVNAAPIRVVKFILKFPYYIKNGAFKCLIYTKNYVASNPKLKKKAQDIINKFPALKNRLNNLSYPQVSYSTFVPSSQNREFLIDITHLYKEDLKTGIQRVVRSIVNELAKEQFADNIEIKTVYLTDIDCYWAYKYVDNPDVTVVPKKDDVFLGLDLNSAIIGATNAGLFADWRTRGMKINFVVYDILPILHPSWWPENVNNLHTAWLDAVLSSSDSVFCISKAVMDDVSDYIQENQQKCKNIPTLDYFRLGADIDSSVPSSGLPVDANFTLDKIKSNISFLMVGTLEPRKGHRQTLKAFEELWRKGYEFNLVIVGKAGWLMDDLIKKINNHNELNSRLFWLNGISDEYLEELYAISTCLIVASEGEGFGLPLIEAAQKKLPIIARDLKVFKEVAGDNAHYFENSQDSSALSKEILNWVELYKNSLHVKSESMDWATWRDSALDLVNKIDLNLNKVK